LISKETFHRNKGLRFGQNEILNNVNFIQKLRFSSDTRSVKYL